MGKLEDTNAGDPIEDHKLIFNSTWVQIVLEDQGSPTGRFLNDIASWTLRGIAEWMTKNDHFREISAKVYYHHYFCGVVEVGLLQAAETAGPKINTTASTTTLSGS